jgi:hypothetical protein
MTVPRMRSSGSEAMLNVGILKYFGGLVSVAALGGVLLGCAGKEVGSPQPQSTASVGSTPPDQTSTMTSVSRSSSNDDSISNLDACGLLTDAEVAQLGLTNVQKGGVSGCDAKYPERVTVGITVRPSLGLGDFQLGQFAKPFDISLGKHKAKRVEGAVSKSSCAVAIAVTEKSRVDVFASSNADPQQACDAAMKVATAVEPKLP